MSRYRERPLPAEWSVERARNVYFEENGFSLASYDEPRTEGSFLGFRFTVPNPPRHRWAIMRHDLHHREYDRLVSLSVGELRESLGIPPAGLARGRRGLHTLAPERR